MEEDLNNLIKQVAELTSRIENLENYLDQRNKEMLKIINYARSFLAHSEESKKFPYDDYQI